MVVRAENKTSESVNQELKASVPAALVHIMLSSSPWLHLHPVYFTLLLHLVCNYDVLEQRLSRASMAGQSAVMSFLTLRSPKSVTR